MTSFRNTRPNARADSSTDADLLGLVATGDLTALGALYDRHARHVWRVLHRVTNGGSDVEDVLHATFLQLPKIASSFDGRSSSCRNWLCGVATRLALRHGRGAQRLTAMLSRLAAATARHSILDPEYQAGRREELRVLEDTLSNLSPKMRAVFVLVELQGLSHAEVAEALQIPLPTVRTRLFGAKAALRKSLVRHESGEGHEP